MKHLFILIVTVIFTTTINSQLNKIDTNYATSVVSADWMPDGKSILIAVVKYHKRGQAPFTSKVFNYDLGTKQLTPLFDNGGNLAPSPDGKTIAYLKRDDRKRTDIYFFNTVTKKETVLKTDTARKNSLEWSPDGKYLLYNISRNGTGQHATIEICVLNIATKRVKQITRSDKDKSYDPNWGPDSKKIVYYLEKGDGHDQIWLTDTDGSFHTNLTNDTTTHNYFPSWFDAQTIVYTQSQETITLMNINDRKKIKIEGIKADQVKYNAATKKFVYTADNKVILFDWKNKTETMLLDGTEMIDKY